MARQAEGTKNGDCQKREFFFELGAPALNAQT